MFEFTLFETLTDSTADNIFAVKDWKELTEFFYLAANKRVIGDKTDQNLISPAIFSPRKRANANVQYIGGFFMCDVDHIDSEEISAADDLEELLYDAFPHYNFLCHSTGSCTNNHIKFRLILPLTERIEKDQFSLLWDCISRMILDKCRLEIDKQAKDPARSYFLPGQYSGKYNFCFDKSNRDLFDPNTIIDEYQSRYAQLRSEHQQRRQRGVISDEIYKKYLAPYKQQYCHRASKDWSSYNDCKYFPHNMVQEYQELTETGWYHTIYRMMCAIAINSSKDNYNITPQEIADLILEFDRDNGSWYQNRPLLREAENAIQYGYQQRIYS